MAVTIHGYSRTKDGSRQLSANFRVREFACRDGSDPVFAAPELVELLQKIRSHFQSPVTVTSGYRTPAWNKKVDGAPYSQHLLGAAADIQVRGVTPEAVAAYAEELLPGRGGIGIYPYILCGSILVIGPLVYGFSKRRRYERRSRQ